MDRVNISDTRIRGEYRIDLFDRVICGELQLSESMKARSVKRYESGDVSLHVCSGEDIFLLKSVTEREGDISDCNNLIRMYTNFDWSVFIGELKLQMTFGNPIWITYVMERLVRMNMEARRPQTFKEVSELEDAVLTKWADDYERSATDRSG